MTNVWPRLPARPARLLLEDVSKANPMTLRHDSATSHPEAAPVAVGGPRVSESTIETVRNRIQGLADSLGFPSELSKPNVASFDRPATRILYDEMRILPADAASEEVWSFVSLVVLPDVAVWRFPGRADDRLLGRPRNVFRRLWWRAETVGVDVIDAPRGLGEDELVNIMERPTLAANPFTANLLARLIFERGDTAGVARSDLMREVSKRFLRQQAVLCIDAIDGPAVQELLDACFAEATRSLKGPAT